MDFMAKQSFAINWVPKRSLGTRRKKNVAAGFSLRRRGVPVARPLSGGPPGRPY